ncbi:MAG TPA: carbamoyl phosphate synthase small subunit, partial [Dehalococcoidia bacterium]|nr:carbamoyl phosphate synthase small subunit [Dehalococcoidia bacterium]
MGIISVNESPELTLERLKDLPSYDDTDFVSRVTTAGVYGWDQPIPGTTPSGAGYRILVTDTGLKYNILRLLRTRGCEVIAFPASVSADELLERQPDG